MSWTDDALCRGAERDYWFSNRFDEQRVAAQVCRRCPVRGDCTAYALELLDRDVDLYGVWGGVNVGNPRQRARLRGRRAVDGRAAARSG